MVLHTSWYRSAYKNVRDTCAFVIFAHYGPVTFQIQIQISNSKDVYCHNTYHEYMRKILYQVITSNRIAIYQSTFSKKLYTSHCSTYKREANSTYYGNGSTKPFRIYGLHIWSTFNAYTKNRCKVQNIFNELCTQSYWCLGTRLQHHHWVSNEDTAVPHQANDIVFLW